MAMSVERAPARSRLRADEVLLLAALFLVALNLRAAIAAVPPLLDTIQRDTGLGGAGAGLLTALSIACMGLFAPLGHTASERIGRERAVSVALGCLAAGCLLRLDGTSLVALYAS